MRIRHRRKEESFVNPRFPVQADGVTPNLVFKNAPGTRNMYQIGARPVIWIADNIAIEGQVYGVWADNVRGWAVNTNPNVHPGTLDPTAFSRSGEQGVFTIAPTIKPKGGFFTRPELRVFGTCSIWSNSWKGATTPIQEGGNTGGFTPSPYANAHANQGWFGVSPWQPGMHHHDKIFVDGPVGFSITVIPFSHCVHTKQGSNSYHQGS